MSDCFFSIILPVKNEGSNIKMTIDSILQTNPETPYEIIVVDDNSQDDCCGFLTTGRYRLPYLNLITTGGAGAANARNIGAEKAKGNILVFCDAHITVPPDWLFKMAGSFSFKSVYGLSPGIASMTTPNAVGYGQTWNNKLEVCWLPKPQNMDTSPLLPGGCQAFRKEAFLKVGGYDRGFKVWGREDEEISLKMWLFGYSLFVDPDIVVQHLFRNSHPYTVTQDHVHYNFLRMAFSHFSEERLSRAISLLSHRKNCTKLVVSAALSDIMRQRTDYHEQRAHTDDWFMNKFAIPF